MGDLLGDRPVFNAGGDDEQLAGPQHDGRLGVPHVDSELTVPTEEQLILVVVMPGELTLKASNPNDRAVDRHEIGGLPRPFE